MPQIVQRVLKHPLLIILMVVAFAFWQTILMYFWNDDNAVIFKLQNLNEGVGNLGSGIFGLDSPYRMVIFTLVPIYYIFGLNSYAFFSYGIFFYFLAAVSVFIFAKSFFKRNSLALVSSLVFSSGLVGAESVWRIYNSVHTSITIIYVSLFCSFYNYFIYEKRLFKKFAMYLFAILFFVLAVQWGFVRAHGLIIIAIAQEVLFNFSFKYSLFRLLPFIYFAYIWYFAGSSHTKHLSLLLSRIFENYEFNLLLIPLKTLQNITIPDIFNFPFLLFIALLGVIILKFRSKILFFSLIFIISNYLTYYMIYHDAVLNTTHRYLTTSAPGLSILIAYLISKIFKSNKKIWIITTALIVVNLVILNWIHFKILKDRSIPTRVFYEDLKKEIPTLSKNSVIFFDTKKESDTVQLFESFFGVGSMPNSTAVAIYYGLDRYDILLTETFEDFLSIIKEKKIKPANAYSFFYSKEKGLKNTSEDFRHSVWDEKRAFIFEDANHINYYFSSPLMISLNLTPKIINSGELESRDISNLKTYLSYLQARRDYYNLISVNSDTHWQNFTPNNLIDSDYSTSWMASRGVWHDTSIENIILDLGEQREVGGIKLKFAASDKTPTQYSYNCSIDSLTWQNLIKVYFSPRNHAQEKIDLVEGNNCRYIKLKIEKTHKGDSPEIAEIEIIEKGFENLDFKLAQNYESTMASLINSKEKDLVLDYLTKNGLKIEICFLTDEFDELNDKAKSKLCEEKFVKIGHVNQIELIVPQSGTILKKIYVLPQDNVEFEINGIKGSNMLFKELK